MAEAPHTWVETKPDSAARKFGVTHTCRCGAAKGSRPYMESKGCRIKMLMKEYRECENCVRGGTIVTQAFTRYICRICGLECSHPNGDTPAICEPCSKKNEVCRKCGAPLSSEKKAST